MPRDFTIDGTTYAFPETTEEDWGDEVTNWAEAVTTKMLSLAGGSFVLKADIDFGANFGLKSVYLKSRSASPSQSGVLRLGNAEAVGWRNAADSADLALSVSASDVLEFDGDPVAVLSASLTASRALASDANGGIAASGVTDTELGYLSGVTSAVQTQLDSLDSRLDAAELSLSTVESSFADHSSSHERGGADEIDGDHLDIDFIPSNYTPDVSPVEADAVTDLAAHLAGIDSAIGAFSGVPSGVVLPYVGTAAPSGFLMCDGSAVSRATYSALFAVIGITHGQGDGSTTFNLPDYRGRFLRGVDGGAANDPDRFLRTEMATGGNTGDAVGSVQSDEFKAHNHSFGVETGNGAAGLSTAVLFADTDSNGDSLGVDVPFSNTLNSDLILPSGGNETRPKNAYVNFIIKT